MCRERAKLLHNRINKVALGKILVLALDKKSRKLIEKLVDGSCDVRLRWMGRKVRKASDLEKLLQPSRMGFLANNLRISTRKGCDKASKHNLSPYFHHYLITRSGYSSIDIDRQVNSS